MGSNVGSTPVQPPAHPLNESLESLYKDGKVYQRSIDVIKEHVKLLADWNRPDARDNTGTARGKLPLSTYAQDHPCYGGASLSRV